jgi:hypothetical protein
MDHTFSGLDKITHNLYDSLVEIAGTCMILMVADAKPTLMRFLDF